MIQRPTTLTDYHHFCEAPQKGNTRNYLLAVKKRALSFNKVVTEKGNNVEMYTTYLTKKENITVLCEYALDNRNKCTRYILMYYSILYREFHEYL